MIYCCFPSFKVWQLPNTACTIFILWLFDYNCNTNYARISSVKLIVSWRSFLATKTFILSRSRWGTSKIYRIVKGEKGPNPRTWKMSGYNYHMGKQTKKKGMHFPPSWIPVSGRALTGVWSKSYRTKLPACFLTFCFAAVEVERLAGQWAGLPGQPAGYHSSPLLLLTQTWQPWVSPSSRDEWPWSQSPAGEVPGAQRPEELPHKPRLLPFLLSNLCHLEELIQPTSVISVMLGRVWYPLLFLLAAALWQKFWIQCHKHPTPGTTMRTTSSLSTFVCPSSELCWAWCQSDLLYIYSKFAPSSELSIQVSLGVIHTWTDMVQI